jgi:hypothetical protein
MAYEGQIWCAALLAQTQPPSRGSQEGCQANKATLVNLSKKSTDTACDPGLEVRRIGVISISMSVALAQACAEVAPSHVDPLACSLARVRARLPSPKNRKISENGEHGLWEGRWHPKFLVRGKIQ